VTSNQSGTYSAGAVIDIQVHFDRPVNVDTAGGFPTLLFETGDTDRAGVYRAGTGTHILTYRYIVQKGDRSPDLDYVNANSLQLNGGLIRDLTTNAAAVTQLQAPGMPTSLSAMADIVIDTGRANCQASMGDYAVWVGKEPTLVVSINMALHPGFDYMSFYFNPVNGNGIGDPYTMPANGLKRSYGEPAHLPQYNNEIHSGPWQINWASHRDIRGSNRHIYPWVRLHYTNGSFCDLPGVFSVFNRPPGIDNRTPPHPLQLDESAIVTPFSTSAPRIPTINGHEDPKLEVGDVFEYYEEETGRTYPFQFCETSNLPCRIAVTNQISLPTSNWFL
jgi:hypothetical protein